MNHYISKTFLFFFILFFFSCKKDKQILVTIKGTLLHTITGKPISGYNVVLVTYHNIKKSNDPQTNSFATTDINGIFSFDNININDKNNSGYELQVLNSKHTIGYPGSIPKESYAVIDETNVLDNYTLKTLPLFDYLTIKLNPSNAIIYPDSIFIELESQFYDQNDPYSYPNYKTSLSSKDIRNNNTYKLDGKAMGLWRMNIFKIKNGITTNTIDSIFLNFDSQTTYTLSF